MLIDDTRVSQADSSQVLDQRLGARLAAGMGFPNADQNQPSGTCAETGGLHG